MFLPLAKCVKSSSPALSNVGPSSSPQVSDRASALKSPRQKTLFLRAINNLLIYFSEENYECEADKLQQFVTGG